MTVVTHHQRCAVLSTEQFGLVFEFDGAWTDHDWDFSRCVLVVALESGARASGAEGDDARPQTAGYFRDEMWHMG